MSSNCNDVACGVESRGLKRINLQEKKMKPDFFFFCSFSFSIDTCLKWFRDPRGEVATHSFNTVLFWKILLENNFLSLILDFLNKINVNNLYYIYIWTTLLIS